jgi:hypothetical protein
MELLQQLIGKVGFGKLKVVEQRTRNERKMDLEVDPATAEFLRRQRFAARRTLE